MLRVFNYLEHWPVSFEREKKEAKLIYYAGDLMESLMMDDRNELQFAINRAFRVCAALGISVQENFKSVIRFDGENLHEDWKISSLACYLIIVNANPINPNVARAQLYYIHKQINHV